MNEKWIRNESPGLTGRTRVRRIFTIKDTAREGSGFFETLEETWLTEEGMEELTLLKGTLCRGCLCVLHIDKDKFNIGGLCVICRGGLCAQCAQVRCSAEECLKPVCPEHRMKLRDKYYCSKHFLLPLVGFIIGFLIPAAILFGVFWMIFHLFT